MTEKAQASLCDRVSQLVEEFGEDKIREQVEKLLKGSVRQVPAEYIPILHADQLDQTLRQLDAANNDTITAGNKKEAAYANKRDLLQRRSKLEAAIKLQEADAIMNIQGEGRNQYVIVDGTKKPLTNDTMRDSYRRMQSADLRKELAEIEGELQGLEVDIAQARDAWETVVEASGSISRKAQVQAYLLKFLSRG